MSGAANWLLNLEPATCYRGSCRCVLTILTQTVRIGIAVLGWLLSTYTLSRWMWSGFTSNGPVDYCTFPWYEV